MAAVLDEVLPEGEGCVDHPRVLAHVQGCIDAVNATLPSYETLKQFRVLPRDLTIEDGEITPTLKVKRRVVQRTYESVIDSMYSEKFN
jgi:long-chain acyl-CoA synthetase